MRKIFFISIFSILIGLFSVQIAGCSGSERGWNIENFETESNAGEENQETADVVRNLSVTAESNVSSAGTIMVHVCGAVAAPGVYELSEGSRVCDAIAAAGGMTEDAAASYLNLAEEVADSQKIVVLTISEAEEDPYGTANEGTVTGTSEGASAGTASGLININTADASALTSLPGIGDTKAAAIIAYRQLHGNFSSIEEITSVSGIGDSTFENIRDLITV